MLNENVDMCVTNWNGRFTTLEIERRTKLKVYLTINQMWFPEFQVLMFIIMEQEGTDEVVHDEWGRMLLSKD